MIPRGQQVGGRFKYLLFLYIDTIDQLFLLCLGRFPIWSILLRWASDGFGCTCSYGTSKKNCMPSCSGEGGSEGGATLLFLLLLWWLFGDWWWGDHITYVYVHDSWRIKSHIAIKHDLPIPSHCHFFLKTWIIVSAKGFFCFNDFFKKPPMFPHWYW